MSYYQGPVSHVGDKIKVIQDFTNYVTKWRLEDATGIDTSYLATKKYFVALKAEVDQLHINWLLNVPTSRWLGCW